MPRDLKVAYENALMKARVKEHEELLPPSGAEKAMAQHMKHVEARVAIDEPELDEPAGFEAPSALDRLNPEPAKKTRKPNAAKPKNASHKEFIDLWNSELHKKFNTPKVLRWSKVREDKLKARLEEQPDLGPALQSCPVNSFLVESRFATFDWIVNPKNLTKLLEGNYSERELPRGNLPKPATLSPQELARKCEELAGPRVEPEDDPGITSILARDEGAGGSDLDDPDGNPF
jgi:hypothetical protein